jgi:pimeloyl-ACP methyl ester carboxylesterase
LDPNAVDLLVEAFRFLEGHEAVKPERIGLAGFCVGASFATLAAQDGRIRDNVAYVNSFGGYFDARDLIVSIVSRTRLYQGVEEPWEPRDDTQEVFTVHLIEGLADPLEREALASVFLDDDPGPGADPNALPDTVSDTGQTVYRLLNGVSRAEAEILVDSLPPSFARTINAISPSTSIAALKAPVLIMHDREDSAIPASESTRLAGALAQRDRVYYTEFSIFQHVDPTRPLPPLTMAREVWKLLLHVYNIMRLSA